MNLDPSQLDASERYKLLIGAVTPRPIALISTRSVSGVVNVAPFSFFNAVSATPPILAFCPVTRDDGGDKDSLRNALPVEDGGTGEFVINVAVESTIRQVAAASEPLGPEESELELTGLTAADSRVVAVPRIAESPVAFECRTRQVVRFRPGVPMSGNLVLGDVVHVHVRDDLIDDRLRIDPEALATIGRLGGPFYCRTKGSLFELARGRAALQAALPFVPG